MEVKVSKNMMKLLDQELINMHVVETAINIYLNNADVKKALNVPDIPWIWQGLQYILSI